MTKTNERWRQTTHRTIRAILLVMFLALPLAACRLYFWEPRAPQRSVALEELLIDQDVMPANWTGGKAFFPTGDDLAVTEGATRQFGTRERDSLTILARQTIYRRSSAGIARRAFEHVYLPTTQHCYSVDEWTYQSSAAERSYLGCCELAGHAGLYCEWAATYEEYIVMFGSQMAPEGMSLEDLQRVVEAIDERMAQGLTQ